MDFVFTEEQDELRAVLREYFSERSPEKLVRELMETEQGFDRAQWKGLAEELGLQGISIPEEYGGVGLGSVELGIVMEELGSTLACVPFFSTVVLATTTLLASDGDAKETWLPRIVGGDVVATLAVTEDGGRWDLGSISATATRSGDGWTLTGRKDFVLDGHTADMVLVAAEAEGRVGIFLVEADSAGFSAAAQSTMDQTRKFSIIDFDATPAVLVAKDGAPILARVYDTAIAALSAEQIGGSQRCLDLAVEYAKTRLQFGRAIGSFQAIKHKCADMLILIESARAASSYALWSADHDPDSLPVAASMAKVTASEAFFRAAADTIQIHGGIGFTWEHPAHLYFKRAKSSELWLGDPALHRERIGRLLELTAAS